MKLFENTTKLDLARFVKTDRKQMTMVFATIFHITSMKTVQETPQKLW